MTCKSSTSFQASADSASDSNEPECEPLRSAKSTPIAAPSSPSIGQLSLFSETFESSQPKLLPTPSAVTYGSNQGGGMGRVGPVRPSLDTMARRGLISSAEVSPAKTSVSPERAQALRASARAYGKSSGELLAKYDHDTASWKTSQLCLDGDLALFSETWPRSGTMRNGTAYLLPPLVLLTDEIGSGSWPTPHGMCVPNKRRAGPSGNELGRAVNQSLWATPSLARQVYAGMWPTPKGSPSGPDYARMKRDGSGGDDLATAVARQNGGSLNPTWVEWLMGFPLEWTALEHWVMRSSRKSPK